MRRLPGIHRAFAGLFVSSLLASNLLSAEVALAQEKADLSRAEELFRTGKALLGQHDYVRACPLLAASYDLDPGTGVLLALAICHEGEGKLASASAEYKQAAARAKDEGRADRERVARDRAALLEPRLSTLSIAPPADAGTTAGFVIRRSGVVVDRSAWDTPIALDGGEYVVEASASGKKPWRSHVTLAPSGEHRTLSIPPLEDASNALPVVAASGAMQTTHVPPQGQATESRADRNGPSPLQIAGLAAMGAGVAGLGVGTIHAFRAMTKDKDSEKGCQGDVCNEQGEADRQAALAAGDMATVGFAVGGTLAVGGFVMFLLGAESERTSASAAPSLRGGLAVGPDGALLSFGGNL